LKHNEFNILIENVFNLFAENKMSVSVKSDIIKILYKYEALQV